MVKDLRQRSRLAWFCACAESCVVFNTEPCTVLPDNSILNTANMQSETGFPSSHQLKSYVDSKSRLKLAARSVLSADAGLLVVNTVHICRVRVRVRASVRLKVSITWQNTIIMVAFYIMLARPVGRFLTVLQMNFPVMLIAEDICGLWLGLCRYADIGIGLAPLVCPYL